MKWGPLVIFLQNLPELHPHPFLITAVPCLDTDAHRLQMTLQTSLTDQFIRNIFLLQDKYDETKDGILTAQGCFTFYIQYIALGCRCASPEYLKRRMHCKLSIEIRKSRLIVTLSAKCIITYPKCAMSVCSHLFTV